MSDIKDYTVYMHINLVNNKKYIGITCQKVSRRWGGSGEGYLSKKKNGEYK